MSIQNELNKIKNAVYGSEVRGAIHDALQKTYDDASEKDNANMEVKIARGTHPNLRSRLEEVDDKQQQTTAQLAQTNSRISETIAQAGDGTIPTELVDIRTVDDRTYTVAGDAVRAINNKLNQVTTVTKSKNLFDKTKAEDNFYYSDTGERLESTRYAHTGLQKVEAGKTIAITRTDNTTLTVASIHFFKDNVWVSYLAGTSIAYGKKVTIPSGVNQIVANLYLDSHTPEQFNALINVLQIEYGEVGTSYQSYDDIKVELKGVDNKLNNKKWLSIGTSITFYDGVKYNGLDQICYGYQSVVKEKINLTLENIGVSGSTIASDSNYGFVDHYTEFDYTNHDLITIEHAVNDHNKNKPIGTIGDESDTTHDVTTFYGAYRTVLDHILTENPTARVVLFTPIYKENNLSNTLGLKLSDYRDAVLALSEMYRLPVCDMFISTGINKFNILNYTIDGLHPNDPGHRRMGESLIGTLNSI